MSYQSHCLSFFSLEGHPLSVSVDRAGGGAAAALPSYDPDNSFLQHTSPHVGQVHLQLGGDEGKANLEDWVPLEDGASESHPAKEAGPAAGEEVVLPEKNRILTLFLEMDTQTLEGVSKEMDLYQRKVYL